jgi:signal transduction histidine kinase
LHGIILGGELLHDTALDAFQGDLLHSMETCSRTLLDTVDHLLDWSGVNNFLSPAPVPQNNGDVEERGLRPGKMATIESGMMSIVSRVRVDLIVEEVVESVYAGRIFQLRTLGSNGAANGNVPSLDAMQPSELIDCQATQKESDIATICVEIEPNSSWEFYAQPGALRRVVMNLVSNSLKFTTKGFVKVSLDQPQIEPAGEHHEGTYVRLTVTDSGCGIGKSYLENDVFTPFIQEDGLKPGMGLGLSFVERIVTALQGSISIQSVVDKGTSVSVTLPLPAVLPESATPRLLNPRDEFEAQRNDLRGLRVLLLGFRDTPSIDREDGVFGVNVVERESIANICRDWLQMQVVDPSESNTLVPDLLLCDETYLHLNLHIHTQRNASSPPAVVICKSAISARDLAENSAFKRRPNDQLWEFSAQP